ncbi:hypothetical protein KFL_000290210 [Klebsormidium nitens]|uniref:Uncharacterized protein n=1 Tax=Klebsormidium nitens TaxID=105231 RepID=A0A1Y1HQV6_KLENI|nr:hypothetical protein KFL_000290210 [Klebsormidium nitens]|eukprot:GAQ79371.1 hypothetical protein KFL_000290210 [Klebsormidium nitens]
MATLHTTCTALLLTIFLIPDYLSLSPVLAVETCLDGSTAAMSCTGQECSAPLCPRFPTAQCNPDPCNECRPSYNIQKAALPAPATTVSCNCSDNSLPLTCVPNPCTVLFCLARPNAICISDYCNGCNAVFYNRDGSGPVDCGVQTSFSGNVTLAGNPFVLAAPPPPPPPSAATLPALPYLLLLSLLSLLFVLRRS